MSRLRGMPRAGGRGSYRASGPMVAASVPGLDRLAGRNDHYALHYCYDAPAEARTGKEPGPTRSRGPSRHWPGGPGMWMPGAAYGGSDRQQDPAGLYISNEM